MNEYKQKETSMPRIEVIPRAVLNEKECYQLQSLLVDTTLRYLQYINKGICGVTYGRNTGINPYAPLEFRDECGMNEIRLQDLVLDKEVPDE